MVNPRKRKRVSRKRNDGDAPKRTPRRPAEQPRSMLDFQRMFPSEAACADYMERVRWPDGFVCPSCRAKGEPYRFAAHPAILECRSCKKETSLTAGTVMHKTKQPLQLWFNAAYLVTTQTPGMSALQFQRQMGISRYETAFQMLHKLRAGMMRPELERDSIGDPFPVEVDEAWIGGKTIGKGRGVTDASLVVIAVEVRERASPKKSRASYYAGRVRMRHVVSRERAELEPFVRENVLAGSVVRTDGCNGYDYLKAFGYKHQCKVLHGDAAATKEWLPMVHIVISNLKTWLRGTHHGVSPQHLQTYLNEYVFRFNRRFYPMTSFASVLGIGSVSRGPTYEGLYSGDWEHKRNDAEAAHGASAERQKPAKRRRWANRR